MKKDAKNDNVGIFVPRNEKFAGRVYTFDVLVSHRKRQKISISEMARKLGIDRKTLTFYENGDREISARKQDEYADVLGMRIMVLARE